MLPHPSLIVLAGLQPPVFKLGPPFSAYASRGGGVNPGLLYISVAYYMQKKGGWVQIACKIAYALNGRPFIVINQYRKDEFN